MNYDETYNNNNNFMGMPKQWSYNEYNNVNMYAPSAQSQGEYRLPSQPLPYSMIPSNQYNSNIMTELPFEKWWPMYSKSLYILGRTYIMDDPQYMQALYNFLVCLANLIPNEKYRKHFQEFLQMKSMEPGIDMVSAIKAVVPNVFQVYPGLEYEMRQQPGQFFNNALQNKDNHALFRWVYLLHAWFLSRYNATKPASYQIKMPTLNDQRMVYEPNSITKADWGNSFWYVIHTCGLYAPQPCEQSFNFFKKMMSSLVWLLPCPLCRGHLNTNLPQIDFDSCPKTNEELFKCTWKLHNIVNLSEGKKEIPLQQAFANYTF